MILNENQLKFRKNVHADISSSHPQWQRYHTLPGQKKVDTLIFHCTAFSFDYSTHLPMHCFDELMQCHNIYFCPELNTFFSTILITINDCIDDGRVGLLCKVFSSASQILSMGFRSGHCGSQSMG